MRERIVDSRVCKLSKPKQYAVYFILEGGGRTGQTRLKDAYGKPIVPTAKTWKEEPDETKKQITMSIYQVLQDRLANDELVPQKNKYKTCREAMESYRKWHEKNRKTAPRNSKAQQNISQIISVIKNLLT